VRRRLFNLAAAVSLVLSILATMLWVWSYNKLHTVVGNEWAIESFDGELSIFHVTEDTILALRIPYWLVGLLCAPGALWSFVAIPKFVVARIRLRYGHCPACGYDLRATPDRCPECGRVPSHSAEAR
jgi:hypothetical protein